MEIREGQNCVTIQAVDRAPADSPSAADVELLVEVASEQFNGHGFAWIAASAFTDFLTQLRAPEVRRKGEAVVERLSPGGFRLRLSSVDGRGHMAVGGTVTKFVHKGEAGPYRHSLEFGFEFCPDIVAKSIDWFSSNR